MLTYQLSNIATKINKPVTIKKIKITTYHNNKYSLNHLVYKLTVIIVDMNGHKLKGIHAHMNSHKLTIITFEIGFEIKKRIQT